MSVSRGGTCPRCKEPVGMSFRGDDPKLYPHTTSYGNRCPAGGLKWSEAKAGWVNLTLRTYKWLLINKPGEAEAYKDRALERGKR